MSETVITRERVYFGPLIGELELRQVSGADFHSLCLSKNSHDRDSTGLRMHAGAHLTTRLLLLLSPLVEEKHWIEIGCGTGVVSLAATRVVHPKVLYLTDGNDASVHLTRENGYEVGQDCTCMRLDWSNGADFDAVLSSSMRKFDVIIGSELLYYRTDSKMLVEAVTRLATSGAIFVHAHVIRVCGQGEALVSYLNASGWVTVEIPIAVFVKEELDFHAEWHSVRCLVSLNGSTLEELLALLPSEIREFCIPFREINISDEVDDEES